MKNKNQVPRIRLRQEERGNIQVVHRDLEVEVIVEALIFILKILFKQEEEEERKTPVTIV